MTSPSLRWDPVHCRKTRSGIPELVDTLKDARPLERSLYRDPSNSASLPPIAMPDPTLSIPVPSDDPKPKKKEVSESNDTKQKHKGEKDQEDLVCLSSCTFKNVQKLNFCSQRRTFSLKMSLKCL